MQKNLHISKKRFTFAPKFLKTKKNYLTYSQLCCKNIYKKLLIINIKNFTIMEKYLIIKITDSNDLLFARKNYKKSMWTFSKEFAYYFDNYEDAKKHKTKLKRKGFLVFNIIKANHLNELI